MIRAAGVLSRARSLALVFIFSSRPEQRKSA